ncbi:hypothetical protein [Botrimarina mediterranea]|uniref:Uncharacterized protein n=1 Tax=Botrimarina mediterranea TaxID=2528022 RepID=A0A518K3F2_9BACT|nr:hypothetical protein [Botrimarina mediterranea]QDV72331.1 hypothetical protein Spa11_05050 [Botrimarina mediterranea]
MSCAPIPQIKRLVCGVIGHKPRGVALSVTAQFIIGVVTLSGFQGVCDFSVGQLEGHAAVVDPAANSRAVVIAGGSIVQASDR